jgi:hydroxypyruvate reductase
MFMRDTDLRHDLLSIYQAAIARVSGFAAVKRYLVQHPLPGRYHLVAIGKAASAMAQGALAAMGSRINAGLVITKHGYLAEDLLSRPGWICMESDHPIPGETSLRAGSVLLDFIRETSSSTHFLFLISGGASSLVEVLPRGVELADLQQLNDALLSGGVDITVMNRARKSVSRIKGGRLLGYLGNRKVQALLVSDVPGNDPAVIGSGMLTPARDKLAQNNRIPEDVKRLLAGMDMKAMEDRSCSGPVPVAIVATLADAKQAAAAKALELGYEVNVYPDFLGGHVLDAALSLASQLRAGTKGVHIWGGETLMNLPPNPGRGGRSQHLSLALALELESNAGIAILAAATDGTDGPTQDAGGLVDSRTIERGIKAGLDARQCLDAADAGRFLHASGDLVTTGPTGTNVMDLVIGIKQDMLQ